MDAFKDIKQIYLLGIGGIGMSALAFWFQRIGKKLQDMICVLAK